MRNPFRGLRFSLLDFHSARATTGTKIAMLGIALIPLIYGALYLMAFYDPYGNLNTMPVAVVNEDVPAYTSAGKEVTAGDDLVAELKDSDSLDYHFVSDEEAQRGLEYGTYYNKIVIPADFSKKIASADSSDPEQARLILVTNDANNYLSSILGASVMRVVTSRTNYAVGQNYYVEIFDSIEQSGDSIKVASDGATELADGLVDAYDGSQTITQNLDTAKNGSSELSDGISSAQSGSATITERLGDAREGASQLYDGLSQLADGLESGDVGANDLYAGLRELQQGTGRLSSGAQALQATLTTNVHDGSTPVTYYAGVSDLAAGTSQLNSQVQQIPDLSGVAGKVASMQDQLATTQQALDGIASGAQQIAAGPAASLESHAEGAREAATAIVGTLAGAGSTLQGAGSSLSSAAANIAAAEGAIAQAQGTLAGASQDEEGAYALTADQYQAVVAALDAAQTSAQGAASFSGGGLAGGDLATASASLAGLGDALQGVSAQQQALVDNLQGADGAGGVKGDLTTIQASVATMMSSSNQVISDSSSMLDDASSLMGQLSGSLASLPLLKGGVYQVYAGAQALKGQLDAGGELNAGIAALSSGATKADVGLATQVLPGMKSLVGGLDQLAAGSSAAKIGAAALFQGIGQLQDGSATLTSGLVTAKDGTASLTSGLDQLHAGSATLTTGLQTAKDGSAELASGLADGVRQVQGSTQGADAKAAMMSEPVELEEKAYTKVDNYGTGFAPYFIALGLWVGALVMTFILKPLNNRLIASGASPAVAAFAGLVPWMIVGAVQALLLGATIQFPCGIAVAHPAAYYALIILSSIVFCAMIQAITALFGFPGKFVAVVLLMLQLTTAAGTFPIQTEFPIFQALSPYLPMTYVVHALRMAMRGLDLALVGHDVAMLLAFGGVSFVLTCLVARRKRLVTMMDLHPLVDL